MAASTAQTVLSVLTIIVSITMRVSPFPDFYRVHKRRETGEVAVLPVVMLGGNCCLLAIYAYYSDNFFPLFSVSVFGVLTSIGFIAVFYRWCLDRPRVLKICAVAGFFVLLDTVYAVLASLGATHQSKHEIAVVTGWVTIFSSVIMIGSPLATIRKVVRTKSAASLPLALCSCNFLNCVLWVAYAAVVNDMFILAPNVAGSALGFIQVTLWIVYRPGKYPHESQVVAAVSLDEIDKNHHTNFNEEASISVVIASPRSTRTSRIVSEHDGHYSVLLSPSLLHKEPESIKK